MGLFEHRERQPGSTRSKVPGHKMVCNWVGLICGTYELVWSIPRAGLGTLSFARLREGRALNQGSTRAAFVTPFEKGK